MGGSKVEIIKKMIDNQFLRFVAYFLKEAGFSNIQQILRRTTIGVDFTAFKKSEKFLIRTSNSNSTKDLISLNSIIKFLPRYNADRLLILSTQDFSIDFIKQAESLNIMLIDTNRIEKILNKRFESCIEFINYLDVHEIKKILKYPTQDLINEYYRLKKFLKKGYVSGNDINLYSQFNWMLYKNRFGSWKNFLEMIGEDTLRFKNITAQDLKADYHRIKKQLKKRTITLDEMLFHSKHSEMVIKRKFGSWIEFMKEVEGSHSFSSHSDKEIIYEYFRVKKQLRKKVVTSNEMNAYGKFSSGVASWRYGSWTKFLIEIGESEGKWSRIDEQVLIDEYLRVKALLKKEKIVWNDMVEYSKFSPKMYIYYFGNWSIFLKIMRGEITKNSYTKYQLIEEYNNLKKLLNKATLSQRDLYKYGKYAVYIYKLKFGSWKNFLLKVDEDTLVYHELTANDIKKDYLHVKKMLDKNSISCQEYQSHGKYKQKIYSRFFGTWKNLVKEMKDEPFRYHISNKELKDEYYRIKKEFDKEYISKDFMLKHSKFHVGTYIGHYGSWGKFLKEIGEDLDYLKLKKLEKLKNVSTKNTKF